MDTVFVALYPSTIHLLGLCGLFAASLAARDDHRVRFGPKERETQHSWQHVIMPFVCVQNVITLLTRYNE